MLYLVFTSLFLFGSVIGWLIVYFIRKYKVYNPKALRDTVFLFLGGACFDYLFVFLDRQLCIVAISAYIIGLAAGFFIHWIYLFFVVKLTAPKFLDPISKYELFSGCNISKESKDELSKTAYHLECISKSFEQLQRGLITEEDFKKLVKSTGLTIDLIENLTHDFWGEMFLASDMAAYIRAKGLLND